VAEQRRYFAAYLQSVNLESGSRYQSLVLPPIPRLDGDEFSSFFTGKFVWWWRVQTLEKQRPKWQRMVEHAGTITPATALAGWSGDNWHVADPILVKVTRTEVGRWLKADTTPYPLIRLLEKKAVLHNIQIQGPTSIPQVVTSTPSS
jgi:hypothetical protein